MNTQRLQPPAIDRFWQGGKCGASFRHVKSHETERPRAGKSGQGVRGLCSPLGAPASAVRAEPPDRAADDAIWIWWHGQGHAASKMFEMAMHAYWGHPTPERYAEVQKAKARHLAAEAALRDPQRIARAEAWRRANPRSMFGGALASKDGHG